jgi:hypothetical protein
VTAILRYSYETDGRLIVGVGFSVYVGRVDWPTEQLKAAYERGEIRFECSCCNFTATEVVFEGAAALLFNCQRAQRVSRLARWPMNKDAQEVPGAPVQHWPHKCPRCKGPALELFTTIECKERCCR